MEGIKIIESLGEHAHRVMDERVRGEEIVLLPSSRVGKLLEILLDRPGLGVNQSEARDVYVVMDVLIQINLVNIQTRH